MIIHSNQEVFNLRNGNVIMELESLRVNMFYFIRNCQPFLQFLEQYVKVSLINILSFGFFFFFSGCVVFYHYGFNLHFLYGIITLNNS